jgi:hypothetical protein
VGKENEVGRAAMDGALSAQRDPSPNTKRGFDIIHHVPHEEFRGATDQNQPRLQVQLRPPVFGGASPGSTE